MSNEFNPEWFSPPGDTIAKLMAAKGMSVGDVATRTGEDASLILDLLAGKAAIDRILAEALSSQLGGAVSFWLSRQSQFEQALASSAKAIGADEASTWLRTLPLKQMRDDGWISTEKDHSTTLQSVLAFFNVSTPQEWEARYTDFANSFAFRTSPSFESKAGALAAWLRRAELRARAQQTRPWSEKNFRAALVEIRRLTRSKSPEKFLPKLQAICATAGVATVVLKSPAGCRASGASRFLSADKAMMILSFRYLSDDHFWFTFFHEAAHLILHQTRKPFVDTDDIESDPREDEANSFAAGVLIPENRQEEMGNLPARADNIIRFAVSAGVSPGVVVGQLQHRKMLGLQQMNGLKRRYTWDQITETTITQ